MELSSRVAISWRGVSGDAVITCRAGEVISAETRADAGRELSLIEITPMGDPLAKTFRVRIALADDTPLQPGMSVEANIITREKPNALLVQADRWMGRQSSRSAAIGCKGATLKLGFAARVRRRSCRGFQRGIVSLHL
jgi:hypothetical protein